MKRFLTLAAAIFALSISAMAQDTVSKTFDLGSFKGVKAGFLHQIHVTEGKSDKIEVTCPEKIEEYLDYQISDGILKLDLDIPNHKRVFKTGNERIVVKIQMKDIEKISLSGMSELIPEGEFRADEADIDISGASKISKPLNLRADKLSCDVSGASECNLKADVNTADIEVSGASKCIFTGEAENIEIDCSGASSAKLEGKTRSIDIDCSGASKVDAEKMISSNAVVSASGASGVRVHGDNRLELQASGASNIKYFGEAKDLRMTNKAITRGE